MGYARERVHVCRSVAITATVLVSLASAQSPETLESPTDRTPETLEGFRVAASRVLRETGVPGAGLALVRADGIEWAGGIGFADRERQTAVTGETHFRVGSISKTFVAMALVQLYEDDQLDLEAEVSDLVIDLAIENPWHATDPVRLIHLLQHTAGFDDMHFADRYVPTGYPEVSLFEGLARNPASRRVRWRPGTRMAYSNVGYGLAGLILERMTKEPYEDYIAREIFEPLGMTGSSFRLTDADEALLASGYDGPEGPPVGFPRIYLRPAGNLHSTPHDLGRFVQMLLGWGELGEAFVVDPEYLSNMEHPRTTLAARAGLRTGYGSGIAARLTLPYPVLGHGGGIDGFLSTYGYSPSRDVGYVVLLNSAGGRAGEALDRLSSLALRYLKREVEPPSKPETTVDTAVLDAYVGYYEDANPRNQLTWPIERLLSGRTIARDGDRLFAHPVWGEPVPLVPVTENTFRRETELDATSIFTPDENGTMVLAGPGLYAERRPRWRAEIVRVTLVASAALIASGWIAAPIWLLRLRRARPRGFWGLKLALLAAPLVVALPVAALWWTPSREWGAPNAGTVTAYLGTLLWPLWPLLLFAVTWFAAAKNASRRLTSYATSVAVAMAVVAGYLAVHGFVGLRTWTY
jgi:CubicO group peptidase (beta-lactamase class C family)